MAKKNGRPSSYTKALGNQLCTWLEEGKTLRAYCDQDGKPSRSTVMRWLEANEEFRNRYAQARERQADQIFDECLQIADDSTRDTYEDGNGNTRTDWEVVGRSKLRIDTRKWFLTKLWPKKYGDVGAEEPKPQSVPVLHRGPVPLRLTKVENDGNGTEG